MCSRLPVHVPGNCPVYEPSLFVNGWYHTNADALPTPEPKQRGLVPLQPLADHDEILTRAEWQRTEEFAEMQARRDARFEAEMKRFGMLP